jgi:hypothetical protein
MYWIKRFALLTLLAIGLSGCAELVGRTIRVYALHPTSDEGPVYMEQIDNDEFLEFVLDNNIVEGLKREDVIYVDNVFRPSSYNSTAGKLILANNNLYEIRTRSIGDWPNYKINLDRLRKEYMRSRKVSVVLDPFVHVKDDKDSEKNDIYWTIPIYKYYYVTPKDIIRTEIDFEEKYDTCKTSKAYKSCERLQVVIDSREKAKPYQFIFRDIRHRYNDIHKIKAIIDERVAYFLSLENNQTNATSVDQ